MTRIGIVVALAVTAAAPGLARAQDAAPPLQENPKTAHFNDVERGWFIGFEAGYLGFFNTPKADPTRYVYARNGGGSAGGLHLAVEIGRDLTSRLSISVFGQGGNESAKASYGSFDLYAAGVDARYAFYGQKDRNDWERFFVYVHGRGGYAVTYPKGLFGKTDTVIQGGPGFEYFTRLRHFSVGASLDFVRAMKAKANGFALYPTVRYTF